MRRQRCPPHGRFRDECGSLLCGCIQGARDRMPDQSLDSVTAWTKQRLGGSTAALAARETHQSTQCRPPTNKPIPHLHDLNHIRRTRHDKKNRDRLQPRAALGLQRCFKEDCFGGGWVTRLWVGPRPPNRMPPERSLQPRSQQHSPDVGEEQLPSDHSRGKKKKGGCLRVPPSPNTGRCGPKYQSVDRMSRDHWTRPLIRMCKHLVRTMLGSARNQIETEDSQERHRHLRTSK